MCMLTPYSYSIYPYIYIYISLYIFKYALNIYFQSFQPFLEPFCAPQRFIEKLSSLGNLFECSQVALIVWIVFCVAGSIRIVCRIDRSHVPNTPDAVSDRSVTSGGFSLVWFSMTSISLQVFVFSGLDCYFLFLSSDFTN